MYQRKDGLWCDTIPRKGQSPKFFYGKTKNEVHKKMREWNEKNSSRFLMSTAISEWLESVEGRIEESSFIGYRRTSTLISEAIGSYLTTEITPQHIYTMMTDLQDKGYSGSTILKISSVTNLIFNYMLVNPKFGVTMNPCKSVRLPSGVKKKRRDLADPSYIEIIKNNANHEFGLFPYLLLYTGLRRGEALALTDKDFSDGYISITKEAYYYSSTPEIKHPKTESSVRKVILLDELKKALPKWKGYLFSADGGKSPLNINQYRKLWTEYCLDLGLAEKQDGKVIFHIVPHQLRHEFATICYDAGLEILDTMELLGHSSPTITQEVYTHIRDSRRKKTFDKLQNFVSSGS